MNKAHQKKVQLIFLSEWDLYCTPFQGAAENQVITMAHNAFWFVKKWFEYITLYSTRPAALLFHPSNSVYKEPFDRNKEASPCNYI